MCESESRDCPVYPLANMCRLRKYRLSVEGAGFNSYLEGLINIVRSKRGSIGSDSVSSVNLDIRVETRIHSQSSRCWDKRQVARVPAHQLIHV
jgi:hypothetical protein